jgi:hypothetical protein
MNKISRQGLVFDDLKMKKFLLTSKNKITKKSESSKKPNYNSTSYVPINHATPSLQCNMFLPGSKIG